MTPTSKLRFVERSQPDFPGANIGRVVHVLQQWWEWKTLPDCFFPGEWRDVPLETE